MTSTLHSIIFPEGYKNPNKIVKWASETPPIRSRIINNKKRFGWTLPDPMNSYYSIKVMDPKGIFLTYVFENLKFKVSEEKDKKYDVNINGKNISFGARGYEHFKDTTPLKEFSKYDHNDKNRLKQYFDRHSKIYLSDGSPAIY